MSTDAGYFDALYQRDDPFGYRDRWYEQRKRALLLGALPCARYRSGWEPACSNGELTALLALRCDALLATDASARAVDLAGARTRGLRNVTVRQASLPGPVDAACHDLVVFSEVGYYLDRAALADCAAQLVDSLADDGTLIACHWLRPFDAAPLSGRAVHAALRDAFARAPDLAYQDADFILQGWSRDPRSVAQREGLA